MDRLIAMLRAAGDPTRLRLLLLLREAELAVSELIEIVGQSQPRVSRHLKLLGEAGLLERFKRQSAHQPMPGGDGLLVVVLPTYAKRNLISVSSSPLFIGGKQPGLLFPMPHGLGNDLIHLIGGVPHGA